MDLSSSFSFPFPFFLFPFQFILPAALFNAAQLDWGRHKLD